MWVVYTMIFIFGISILECISDMINFEKFLSNLNKEDYNKFNKLNSGDKK